MHSAFADPRAYRVSRQRSFVFGLRHCCDALDFCEVHRHPNGGLVGAGARREEDAFFFAKACRHLTFESGQSSATAVHIVAVAVHFGKVSCRPQTGCCIHLGPLRRQVQRLRRLDQPRMEARVHQDGRDRQQPAHCLCRHEIVNQSGFGRPRWLGERPVRCDEGGGSGQFVRRRAQPPARHRLQQPLVRSLKRGQLAVRLHKYRGREVAGGGGSECRCQSRTFADTDHVEPTSAHRQMSHRLPNSSGHRLEVVWTPLGPARIGRTVGPIAPGHDGARPHDQCDRRQHGE
mmetsp:Transcript_705/g.2274  ORF Transcript_705/g.2274 Transcript_705/m.2274 type:complete len:289 (+) Transcript_705:1815-2681(+)